MAEHLFLVFLVCSSTHQSSLNLHTNKQDNNLQSNADDYRVICVDENGEPVPGAKVQFCSNDLCMMGTTDENGIAVFDADPGPNNVVHLLKPPEGYAKDSTAYPAPSFYGDVTITLQAA